MLSVLITSILFCGDLKGESFEKKTKPKQSNIRRDLTKILSDLFFMNSFYLKLTEQGK
jgi:hypothetical protein